MAEPDKTKLWFQAKVVKRNGSRQTNWEIKVIRCVRDDGYRIDRDAHSERGMVAPVGLCAAFFRAREYETSEEGEEWNDPKGPHSNSRLDRVEERYSGA